MVSISIQVANIVDLEVDAIVNSANHSLKASTGVCQDIFFAAGFDALTKACDEIGNCRTGSAVITDAFNLKARFIVHAVAPGANSNDDYIKKNLYSCYRSSLRLAAEHNCHSIAFPLLAAGVRGIPYETAWRKALQACKEFGDNNPVINLSIIFAVVDNDIKSIGEAVYERVIIKSENMATYLVGSAVKHDSFGSGTIVDMQRSTILVDFQEHGIQYFKYPEAIESGVLSFEDEIKQKEAAKQKQFRSCLESTRTLKGLVSTLLLSTDQNDYSIAVMQAGAVAESIMRMVYSEHGYTFVSGQYLSPNQQDKYPTLNSLIQKTDFLPEECKTFCTQIFSNRNRAVHVQGISYGEMIAVVECLNSLVVWFTTASVVADQLSLSEKKSLISLLVVVSESVDVSIRDDVGQRKMIGFEHLLNNISLSDQTPTQKSCMEQEILGAIKALTVVLDQVRNGVVRIETKLDNLIEQVRVVLERIESYQVLVQKQIDIAKELATEPAEIERLIHAYADVCADTLIKSVETKYSAQNYTEESEKLKYSFGESAWNKMDESSKNFLVTAKVIFNKLLSVSDIVDYSGVCLLVTKALEVEVGKRFGEGFIQYLKKRYPGKSNYRMFPTALRDAYGNPLKPKHFTLGAVAHVLCYKTNQTITELDAQNNRERLLEYVKAELLPNMDDAQIMPLLSEYAEDIERVREDYRNPSAHTNQLTKVEARECFDLVVDVEKLMKKMLDAFMY